MALTGKQLGLTRYRFMASRYWVGATNNWDTNTAYWAATSGGAGGQSVPTSSDDVFFDANSGGGTVTLAQTGNCQHLNFTGFTGTFAGAFSLNIYGSLTLSASATYTFSGSSSLRSTSTGRTITSNGKIWTASQLLITGVGGGWTLQDDLILTGNFVLLDGAFDANNFNVTAAAVASSANTARSLSMGSGTWEVTGNSASYFSFSATTNLTFSAGTSLVKFTSTLTANRSVALGGLTWNNIWDATTGAFALTWSGSPTINDFKINGGRTAIFSNTTPTFTVSSFTPLGTVGNLVTMQSNTAGFDWNISKSSGTVNAQYLSLRDSNATGGATWNAIDSTNVSNNTGWNFISSFTPSPDLRLFHL